MWWCWRIRRTLQNEMLYYVAIEVNDDAIILPLVTVVRIACWRKLERSISISQYTLQLFKSYSQKYQKRKNCQWGNVLQYVQYYQTSWINKQKLISLICNLWRISQSNRCLFTKFFHKIFHPTSSDIQKSWSSCSSSNGSFFYLVSQRFSSDNGSEFTTEMVKELKVLWHTM